MNEKHWTGDDFLNHLYGVGPGDGHLDACASCRERWVDLSARRESHREDLVARQELLPEVFLAAQRRSIFHRMDDSVRSWFSVKFASAAAVMALLVFGVFLYQPDQTQVKQAPAISDAQFFSEVSSMAETPAPRAAQPIKGLFQED